MQIKISARHGHLSEASQDFIREKAQKLLHYFDRLMMIEVLVDMKEQECIVEFLVSAEHKHDFVASERSKDVLAAVDMVMHKLEQQVRKYKEKIQDHRRTPSTGQGNSREQTPRAASRDQASRDQTSRDQASRDQTPRDQASRDVSKNQ